MAKLTRKQIRFLKSTPKEQKEFDREITKSEGLLDRRDKLRSAGVSTVSIQKKVKAQQKITNKIARKIGLEIPR